GVVLDYVQLFVGGPFSPVWHVPGGGGSVSIARSPDPLMIRRALLLGFAWSLAAGAVAAQVEGFHYTREVTVAAPGWVRVPLDLAAVQHLAPGAADLHVFSPSGEEVPLQVEPSATRSERRPVAAPKPGRAKDGGWEVVLDMGADPVPHER